MPNLFVLVADVEADREDGREASESADQEELVEADMERSEVVGEEAPVEVDRGIRNRVDHHGMLHADHYRDESSANHSNSDSEYSWECDKCTIIEFLNPSIIYQTETL